MADDGEISFYDVKTRRIVSIPRREVHTAVYTRTPQDGRPQTRYALRGKVDGRNVTKFVNQATAASFDGGNTLIEASTAPPVLETSAIARLDESLEALSRVELPTDTPRSVRLVEAAVRILHELRDGKVRLSDVDPEVFEYLTAELQIRMGYDVIFGPYRSL
jgi:hypothetical protein